MDTYKTILTKLDVRQFDAKKVQKAMQDLGINPEKADPAKA